MEDRKGTAGDDTRKKESFPDNLEELVADCNDVLLKYLPDPSAMPEGEAPAATVADAMRYSVMAGGKRLRPLLIARISDLYGGRRALAEPFMAALEMIHTYSLVHDDLPAMDDDDYRRGRLTTHRVYGEGMAVLAGDALLNCAFETALTAFDAVSSPEESAAVVRAMKILARNAGIFGMVGGQCADLEAEDRGAAEKPGPADRSAQAAGGKTGPADRSAQTAGGENENEGGAAGKTGPACSGASAAKRTPEWGNAALLEYIHSHKTASMISSGFTIGAVLAGAPEKDIALLEQIAFEIGIAFQIQDDILDVTGDSEELGKTVGSDEKDGKATYITIHGLEAARRDVRALTGSALQKWDSLTVEDGFLRDLLEELVVRRS